MISPPPGAGGAVAVAPSRQPAVAAAVTRREQPIIDSSLEIVNAHDTPE